MIVVAICLAAVIASFALGAALGFRANQRAWERIMERARKRLRDEHELARGGPYRLPSEPVVIADLDALDNAPLKTHPPIEVTE